MKKAEVYYPTGMEELKKKIEDQKVALYSSQEKLGALYEDTLVMFYCCNRAFRMGDLCAVAHMYYIDNVYTGHYAVSEYSTVCPGCGTRVREYEQPELKKLREYYKEVTEDKKD